MKCKISLAAVLVVFVAFTALSQLRLKDVPPGEPAEHTFNKRFSMESSLATIEQIRQALASFSKLTEKSRDKLSSEEISAVGNTDWAIQELGFSNWVCAIEGTLRKQHYQIKSLELELARERHKAGKLESKDLKEIEASYREAEAEFQKFWDSFAIAD